MRRQLRYLICSTFIAGLLAGCGNSSDSEPPRQLAQPQTHIARTGNGIAHIRADNFRGLGYGLAYAYAQDNVCMFADSLLTVRGERSRFFGGAARATAPLNGEYGAASDFMDLSNEDSDFFFKGYLDIDQLKAGYAAGSAEARDLLAGYAAGYNRYLQDHAGRLPSACRGAAWVRPIALEDMYLVLAEKALHASGQVFAQEIVDGARPSQAAVRASQDDVHFIERRLSRLTREQLGSNGLAIGRELSANGRGLLLANPHYPWTSTDRFYQAHLTVPGSYDAMGVILGGIPAVVIGFNRDVAWTHTVTTAVHFTTFKLALDARDPSGTTYLIDGVPAKMRSRTATVESLLPDGSLVRRSKTFYFTSLGAVLVKPDAGLVWSGSEVHVLADPNRSNTRLVEQWLAIGRAKSVNHLKASLDRIAGLPWVNTVAADRDGNTLYADASVVPRMPAAQFAGDCLLVPPLLMFDGSRQQCGWGSEAIFKPAEGPWTIRTDYVGNSNDSFWLSNPKNLMSGYSPLYGPTGVEQKLRTRIGFKQMEEAISSQTRFRVDDVQALAFANRIYAAELVLPELLPQCEASGDPILLRGCAVLRDWDRRADIDSRGALLFRVFWDKASQVPGKWAIPFNPADPVNTPGGLAPDASAGMLLAIKAAVRQLDTLQIPLNARLGDYQTETRNGVRFALHGAIGDIDGSYNSIHMRSGLGPQGYEQVEWGTSYVQTVGFDADGPLAQGMLLYGQSVDPASPYYADQLPNYSAKVWPVLPFTAEQVKADPRYVETTLKE